MINNTVLHMLEFELEENRVTSMVPRRARRIDRAVFPGEI